MTRCVVFGKRAGAVSELVKELPGLELVEERPDVVVCYGGDGTLLAAELRWPGVPKAPIRNSRRGRRLMPYPPKLVLERLAQGGLARTEYLKLECAVRHHDDADPFWKITAINELNVHMGHINSAVRFSLWINGQPYESGLEIIGDGFVVCTPFGSTAYYNQITRGIFTTGMGVAFKFTAEHTDHMVLPEDTVVRARITRGPAVLAYDNAPEYFDLEQGDEMVMRRHPEPAILLTCDPLDYPTDSF
jgi:NAD+ kinase